MEKEQIDRNRELSRLRMAKMNKLNAEKYPDRTRKNYNATPAEHEKLKETLIEIRS